MARCTRTLARFLAAVNVHAAHACTDSCERDTIGDGRVCGRGSAAHPHAGAVAGRREHEHHAREVVAVAEAALRERQAAVGERELAELLPARRRRELLGDRGRDVKLRELHREVEAVVRVLRHLQRLGDLAAALQELGHPARV